MATRSSYKNPGVGDRFEHLASNDNLFLKMRRDHLEVATHLGNYDESSDSHPILHFYARYADRVARLELNTPFTDWFADGAIFYNTSGLTIRGGHNIWQWMKGPHFGKFDRVPFQHIVTRVFPLLEDFALADGTVISAEQKGFFRVMDEQVANFIPRGRSSYQVCRIPLTDSHKGATASDGIRVCRNLQWIIGPGAEHLLIWEARTWWDTALLL